MKLRSKFFVLTVLFSAPAAFAADVPTTKPEHAAADMSLGRFAWLAGRWAFEENGATTEEIWSTPSANLIVGMSRTLKGGKTVMFEFTSLQKRDDGIYFVAQPSGKPPVDFRLASFDADEAVFVNPGHADHLQRIVYRHNADGSLTARIEGSNNGKAFSKDFPYRRAPAQP
jgi:hypothetical protein